VIDCLKFIPTSSKPTGGWPTVMMCHGYGDSKETLAGFCKAQAQYGYYTFTYSMRGQGKSGGLSNLISTVEMQDLLEIINYVKNDAINGSNPDNILIMGGSQGGIVPYMAACYGAPVHTIISALAPPNFASSWIENGCIKMTLLWTVSYTPDLARYNSTVSRFPVWIYANNKVKWDSLAYWLPIGRDFMDKVSGDKVPMIIEGSWQDKFFNSSGILQAASLMKAPFRMYIGAVIGHGGDHSDQEDIWHMQFFNDWFFYWLFNYQNGTMDAAKYQYASTVLPYQNKNWTFIHDSSKVPLAQITTNYRLYFNKNNKLASTINGKTSDNVSFSNKVSGGLTMQQAVDAEFTGTSFNKKFKVSTITFNTDPLTKDLKWLGTPNINLTYSSNGAVFCQYNFQIYEVTPDGKSYFVNRINYTNRNYTKNTKLKTLISGQAHSHIFKVGSKIRISVTNLDRTPTDSVFFGTNPFVLPVLVNSTNNIFLGGGSYLELPVISSTALAGELSANATDDKPSVDFSLKQNYPNPFNPVTLIEYSIAKAGTVQIRVYDILGKEIKVLVNEYAEAGTHRVEFNASSLSSGIYFYTINSGGFRDVKRMVLIK
jgi:predicted acyl esterase